MITNVKATEQEWKDAQLALHLSSANAVVSMVAMLSGVGLVTQAMLETIHEQMIAPLLDERLADNPIVQWKLAHLDQLFSALSKSGRTP